MGKRKKKSSPVKVSTTNDSTESADPTDQSPAEKPPKRSSNKRPVAEIDETNLRRSMRTLRIPPEDFSFTPLKYIKTEPRSPPKMLRMIKPEPADVPEYQEFEPEDMLAHTRPEVVDISQNENECEIINEHEYTQRLNSQSGAMVQLNMQSIPSDLDGIFGTQIMLTNSDSNMPLMSCPPEGLLLGRYSFPDIFPHFGALPDNNVRAYAGLTSSDLHESLQSLERSTIWRSLVTQNNLLDEHGILLEKEFHYQERIISLTECVGKTVNIRSHVENELSVVQQKLSPLELENKRLNAQVTELIAERDKSATHHKAEIKANEQRSFHEKKYTEAVETFKSQREKKVKELEATLKATKKEFDAFVKSHQKKINGFKVKTLKIIKQSIGEIETQLKLSRTEFAILKCFLLYTNEFRYLREEHHNPFFSYLDGKLDIPINGRTAELAEVWEQISGSFNTGNFSQENLELLFETVKKERDENGVNFKKDILKKIRDLYGDGEKDGSDAEVNLSEDEGGQQLPPGKRFMKLDSKFDLFKSPLTAVMDLNSSNVGISKNVLNMPQISSPHEQALKTPKRSGPAVAVSKSKGKPKKYTPKGTRGRPKKSKAEENYDDNTLQVSFGPDENSAELGISDSEEEGLKKKLETPAVKRTKSKFKRKRNQDSSSSESTDSESERELSKGKRRKIAVRFKASQSEDNQDDSSFVSALQSELSAINKSTALSDSDESEVDAKVKKTAGTALGAHRKGENTQDIEDLRNDLELSESDVENSTLEETQSSEMMKTPSTSKSRKSKSGSKKSKKQKKPTQQKRISKEKNSPSKRGNHTADDEKTPGRKSFNYQINASTRTLRTRASKKEEPKPSNVLPGFGISQKELVQVAEAMEMEEAASRKKKGEFTPKKVNEVQDILEGNIKLKKEILSPEDSKEDNEDVSNEEETPTPDSPVKSPAKRSAAFATVLKSPAKSPAKRNMVVPMVAKSPGKSPAKRNVAVASKLKSPAATKSKSKQKPASTPMPMSEPVRSVRERIGDTTIPIAITGKDNSCQKSILNEQIQKAVSLRNVKSVSQKKTGSSPKAKLLEVANSSPMQNSADMETQPLSPIPSPRRDIDQPQPIMAEETKTSKGGKTPTSSAAAKASKQVNTSTPYSAGNSNEKTHDSASAVKSPKKLPVIRLKSPAKAKSRPKQKAAPKPKATPVRSVRDKIGDTTVPIPITAKDNSCQKSILNEQIQKAVDLRTAKSGNQRKSGNSAKSLQPATSSSQPTLQNFADAELRQTQPVNPNQNPYQNMNLMGFPPMGAQFGFPGMYNPYANPMNPSYPGFGVNNYQTESSGGGGIESQNKGTKEKSRKQVNQEQPNTLNPTGQQDGYPNPTSNPFTGGNPMFPGMMNPMMNPMFNPMFMNPMFGNSVMPSQYMMNCMNPMMNAKNQMMPSPMETGNDSSSLKASQRTKSTDGKTPSLNTSFHDLNAAMEQGTGSTGQDNHWGASNPSFGYGLPGFNPNFLNQTQPPLQQFLNDGNLKGSVDTPRPPKNIHVVSDTSESERSACLVVDEENREQGELSTESDESREVSTAVFGAEVPGDTNVQGIQKYMAQNKDSQRIDTFDSPRSPSPVATSSNTFGLNAGPVMLSVGCELTKNILANHLKSKSFEELKLDGGLRTIISQLKSQRKLPSSDTFARGLYGYILDQYETDKIIRPSEVDPPLKTSQHKILLFIEKLRGIDRPTYRDLAEQLWNYYVLDVLPNEHEARKYSVVHHGRLSSIGQFFGALCRKFLTPEHAKEFIYAVLVFRPQDALNIAYNSLLSNSDYYSMLPDEFDYGKVNPCEKLVLFVLQNPLQYKHASTFTQIKSLLQQGLRHPKFDCTWDEMLLNTLNEMIGMESEEQLRSATKGLSMLMVQGGWKWLNLFFQSRFDGLVQRWLALELPNVVLSGFLNAVAFGYETSLEGWDVDHLRIEVVRLKEKGKGMIDATLEQGISCCLDSFRKPKPKVIQKNYGNKNHTPPDRRGKGRFFGANNQAKKKQLKKRAERDKLASRFPQPAHAKGAAPLYMP